MSILKSYGFNKKEDPFNLSNENEEEISFDIPEISSKDLLNDNTPEINLHGKNKSKFINKHKRKMIKKSKQNNRK